MALEMKCPVDGKNVFIYHIKCLSGEQQPFENCADYNLHGNVSVVLLPLQSYYCYAC